MWASHTTYRQLVIRTTNIAAAAAAAEAAATAADSSSRGTHWKASAKAARAAPASCHQVVVHALVVGEHGGGGTNLGSHIADGGHTWGWGVGGSRAAAVSSCGTPVASLLLYKQYSMHTPLSFPDTGKTHLSHREVFNTAYHISL